MNTEFDTVINKITWFEILESDYTTVEPTTNLYSDISHKDIISFKKYYNINKINQFYQENMFNIESTFNKFYYSITSRNLSFKISKEELFKKYILLLFSNSYKDNY